MRAAVKAMLLGTRRVRIKMKTSVSGIYCVAFYTVCLNPAIVFGLFHLDCKYLDQPVADAFLIQKNGYSGPQVCAVHKLTCIAIDKGWSAAG